MPAGAGPLDPVRRALLVGAVGRRWRVRGGALLLTLTLAAAVMTHVLPTGASVSSLQW